MSTLESRNKEFRQFITNDHYDDVHVKKVINTFSVDYVECIPNTNDEDVYSKYYGQPYCSLNTLLEIFIDPLNGNFTRKSNIKPGNLLLLEHVVPKAVFRNTCYELLNSSNKEHDLDVFEKEISIFKACLITKKEAKMLDSEHRDYPDVFNGEKPTLDLIYNLKDGNWLRYKLFNEKQIKLGLEPIVIYKCNWRKNKKSFELINVEKLNI